MSETTQANFRIPQELKDLVEKSADANGRSITQEFIYVLEKHYRPEKENERNYIFTEWHPTHIQEEQSSSFIEHNEKVRMACAKYISGFFKDYPTHRLVKLEFKSRTQKINRKYQEVLYGVRIWYTYPVSER